MRLQGANILYCLAVISSLELVTLKPLCLLFKHNLKCIPFAYKCKPFVYIAFQNYFVFNKMLTLILVPCLPHYVSFWFCPWCRVLLGLHQATSELHLGCWFKNELLLRSDGVHPLSTLTLRVTPLGRHDDDIWQEHMQKGF